MLGSARMRLAIAAFDASSPFTSESRPTARSYRASAPALSANRESPEYETIRAQVPFDGPNDPSRAARRLLVPFEDDCSVAEEPPLTWVKPLSDVPAPESAESAESAGADVSGVGAAEAASLDVSAVPSAAGAADSSAAGAASVDESSDVVV